MFHAPTRLPPDRSCTVSSESTTDDALYDAFVDALLDGRVPDVAQFLEQHPESSPALRRQLQSMEHALHRRTGQPAAERLSPPGSTVDPERPNLGLPFEQLGEFHLREKRGEGGMGVVYLAEQESLARPVALKVLPPERSQSPLAIERLQREARTAARLRHPHLVSLYTVGQDHGVHYLAMEWVEGVTLEELLARTEERALATDRVIRWGAKLARALHYAHEHGVVHRDVKPSNILITDDDEPKLLDFGLARDVESAVSLTQGFVGSPAYMAPEQIAPRGGDVDARTDVYGLGATLYQCLGGEPPFSAERLEATFRAILEDPLPSLRRLNPAIPRDVESVLAQSLARDPRRRYSDAEAFAEDLESILELRPVRARPPSLYQRAREWTIRHPAMAAVLVTLIVGGFLAATVLRVRDGLAQQARVAEAEGLLDDAHDRIARYETLHREQLALEDEIRDYDRTRFSNYTEPLRDDWLDRHEREVQRARERREAEFLDLLSQLSEAERLGADPSRVRRERAGLYLAKVAEARRLRDPVRTEWFAERVRAEDHEGRYADQLAGANNVDIVGVPADVETHLFHFRDLSRWTEDGEPRLVPVPSRSNRFPVEEAPWALRVARCAVGPLRIGDLVLELLDQPIRGCVLVNQGTDEVPRGARLHSVDGEAVRDVLDVKRAEEAAGDHHYLFTFGERSIERSAPSARALGIELANPRDVAERGNASALVWSDGELSRVVLPHGVEVRTTAAPLFLGPGSRLAHGPVSNLALEVGHHLLVLRPPSGAPIRYVVEVHPGTAPRREVRVELPASAEGLEGFVFVQSDLEFVDPFWIQEREVQLGEYLSFLNDPIVNRQIPPGSCHLVPRDPATLHLGGILLRAEDGTFSLPDWLDPRLPVHGVSWFDAAAYVEWRNTHAPDGLQFSLPTEEQWSAVAVGGRRRFVFGDSFRHKWASTCFARKRPQPEIGMAFPIDESPYGVFDLTGSVSEWLNTWELEGVQRRLAGGSWGTGGPVDLFHAASGQAVAPDTVSSTMGLRMAATRRGNPTESSDSSALEIER